jgi:biotin-(acetyl-CoA carboxylase) ligase
MQSHIASRQRASRGRGRDTWVARLAAALLLLLLLAALVRTFKTCGSSQQAGEAVQAEELLWAAGGVLPLVECE